MTLTLVFICLFASALAFPELRGTSQQRSCRGTPLSSDSLRHKDDLLDTHNDKRALERQGLPRLTWDDELAMMAQKLADTCVYGHGMKFKCNGQEVGQNIYAAGTSSFRGSRAVESWYDEKKDYNYNTNTCSAKCGHYTQVVWKNTTKVGCAVANCGNKIFPPHLPTNWFVVCNYFPPGNVRGQRPY